MQTISFIDLEGSRSLREELRTIDEGARLSNAGFTSRLSTDDPRLSRLIERLVTAGYRQWPKVGRRDLTCEYKLTLIREYDASDWEQAEYLSPYVPWEERPDDGIREGQYMRVIGGKDIVEPRDFYLTWMGVLIAADPTRAILEQTDLAGLAFKPVEVDPEDANPFNYQRRKRKMPIKGMPFWAIEPTIKLPPLAPSMTLTDHKGNPLPPGDESAHYKMKEGHYNNAELHFRRSDVEKMKPFDIARTRESFAGVPWAIVSNRFYRVCVENGLKMNWAPVRIDD